MLTNWGQVKANLVPCLALQAGGQFWIHDLFRAPVLPGFRTDTRSSLWFPYLTRPGAIGGDSGNPVCLFDGEELLLLGCWYSATTFSKLIDNTERVNGHIRVLSQRHGMPVYKLEHKDWSTVMPPKALRLSR
jgi:hypothetical protein